MTVQLASIILLRPPARISLQDLDVAVLRESRPGPAPKWAAAHGVDIAQRVGGRNLAEDVGVVDDGRKEIDRLDERQLGRELIHAGVVGCIEADQHVGIMLPG